MIIKDKESLLIIFSKFEKSQTSPTYTPHLLTTIRIYGNWKIPPPLQIIITFSQCIT